MDHATRRYSLSTLLRGRCEEVLSNTSRAKQSQLYTLLFVGWSSLVARRAHNPEVAWFKSRPRHQEVFTQGYGPEVPKSRFRPLSRDFVLWRFTSAGPHCRLEIFRLPIEFGSKVRWMGIKKRTLLRVLMELRS